MSLQDTTFRIFYGPADNPLENFYIPALSASVQYDRSAGYFSSSALAVAAAGVARLIQNGGRMRLLVGAELSEADVEAIQQGHDLQAKINQRLLERFPDPQDSLMKERLQVLAWMVAEGTLDIKVVLPTDQEGYPIPATQTHDYYHVKSGIFTDAEGNRVAFSGSINESEMGWKHNYEQLLIHTSWEATLPHLEQIAINFERLWSGQEANWVAVEIPTAVQERLLKYRPLDPPQRDPLETKPISKPTNLCNEFLPSVRGGGMVLILDDLAERGVEAIRGTIQQGSFRLVLPMSVQTFYHLCRLGFLDEADESIGKFVLNARPSPGKASQGDCHTALAGGSQ